jgi:hypothetical protein
MVDVVLISIIPPPNMLHHNNVEAIYARISNFSVELVRFVSLYFVAIPHFMVIVTKALFTTTLARTIIDMKFKPHTLKGINLVNMHIKMPKEVDNIFVGQPSNLGRGITITKTTTTFKIFWITNGESRQTTITTKHVLSLTI